jgi:PTH1 family peptidyl-tRNA hydrolase
VKLIIGLGNPGGEYVNTRHNAGFFVAEALQKRISNLQFTIYKSPNFMNESGSFVKKLVDQYKLDLSNLYVVHDDLDIKLGEYKIQFGKGPKDHNGVKSVDEALGSGQYWHVRIGVDNRPLDGRPMGIEYVLEKFSGEEMVVMEKVIKEVCKKLATL